MCYDHFNIGIEVYLILFEPKSVSRPRDELERVPVNWQPPICICGIGMIVLCAPIVISVYTAVYGAAGKRKTTSTAVRIYF